MSEDRVVALGIALKAVLNTAREQGMDADQLAESTIEGLVKHRTYDALHVPMAVTEIELAADALEVDGPVVS